MKYLLLIHRNAVVGVGNCPMCGGHHSVGTNRPYLHLLTGQRCALLLYCEGSNTRIDAEPVTPLILSDLAGRA